MENIKGKEIKVRLYVMCSNDITLFSQDTLHNPPWISLLLMFSMLRNLMTEQTI